MARPGSPPVHTRPGAPPARSQHVMPNAAHVSRAPERHSAPPASAAVVTEMIRPTVPSSQRCHLQLKIHVKSRDATFKQAVEASSGFTIQVSRNPFRASWPPGGDRARAQGACDRPPGDVAVKPPGRGAQRRGRGTGHSRNRLSRRAGGREPQGDVRQGWVLLRPLSWARRTVLSLGFHRPFPLCRGVSRFLLLRTCWIRAHPDAFILT